MKQPAYYRLLEMSEEVRKISFGRTIFQETYSGNYLERRNTGTQTSTIDMAFTQFNMDWFSEVSNPTMLFVMRNIAPALKKYNLLWHWPPTRKRNEKIIIKELVDKQILMRTEVIGIYLVNPLKLWRGTIHSAVECTKRLLREHVKPSLALIHDLRPTDNYELLTSADRMKRLQG